MPTIATDGKGNYVALDDSGNWVPTEAPAPTQKGGGELGYQAAPPENKPPPIDFATRLAGPAPSLDELGLPLPQPSSGGWRDTVDTSITPRPGVATFAPLSRETPTSPTKFAVPNAVRALMYEGPQLDPQGKLTVPAATVDSGSGQLGVTPEAAGAGALLMPGGLRFGGRPPLPPWMPENQFSPGAPGGPPSFVPPGMPAPSLNRLMDLLRADEAMRANKPDFIPPTTSTSVTGEVTPIQQPRNPLPPDQPAPPSQPSETSPMPEPAAPSPSAGPAPASTVPLSADEILARSKSFFSPADQQAAQGAMIQPGASNGIRKVLTDAVPTDPQTALAKGSTPLTQLGKDYAAFQDQPMSFDAAMALDRRLTAEKRTAMGPDPSLAREIGIAQDQIRDKMQSLGPDDTTGDPAALAGLAQARQAYNQWIKETQLDDIRYGANLLPPEKQDAYVRTQMRSLLKSDRSRNWTDDERAAGETAATQGVRGFVGNAAISIIKPLATGIGFKVAGPGGAWLGSNVGEAAGAMARDALARRRPDRLGPVSGAITLGVPQNMLMPPGAPLQ